MSNHWQHGCIGQCQQPRELRVGVQLWESHQGGHWGEEPFHEVWLWVREVQDESWPSGLPQPQGPAMHGPSSQRQITGPGYSQGTISKNLTIV